MSEREAHVENGQREEIAWTEVRAGAATLTFSNLGATLVAFTLPRRRRQGQGQSDAAAVNPKTLQDCVTNGSTGSVADKLNLVVSFAQPESYRDRSNPYFGTTVGRVANRVKKGALAGLGRAAEEVSLDVNEGRNTVHSGPQSYHLRLFAGPDIEEVEEEEEEEAAGGKRKTTVEYRLVDKGVGQGTPGFPGTIEVLVRYTLFWSTRQEDRQQVTLQMTYEAAHRRLSLNDTDRGDSDLADTVVNLTNHSYWNPGPHGTLESCRAELATDRYLEVDEELIPTGSIGRHPIFANKAAKEDGKIGVLDLSDVENKVDHCFVIREDVNVLPLDSRGEPMRWFATLSSADSGVTIRASTTEPTFQFYTGDGCACAVEGEEAISARAGACLEAARYIDAYNHKEWRRQVLLRSGDVYGSTTQYHVTYQP